MNSLEYRSFDIYVFTIKISMTVWFILKLQSMGGGGSLVNPVNYRLYFHFIETLDA